MRWARSSIPAVLIALALPAAAEPDLSAGSEAQSWGLFGERNARFEAVVVDVVCALTGDCPEDCGAGGRQMALQRTVDDVLVLVAKNGEPIFSGATFDLAAFCARTVEVDGLLVGDPEITPGLAAPVYQVQRVRALDGGAWTAADAFGGAWSDRYPEAEGDAPWYRRDPAIRARIEAEGYLGLGPEVDQAFIEEWF